MLAGRALAGAFCVLALAGCASAPPTSSSTDLDGSGIAESIDWIDLADRLPKGALVRYNRQFGDFERDPVAAYTDALRFDARWDSLGVAAFDSLPVAEQQRRRELADDLTRHAFIGVADRAYRLRTAREMRARPVRTLDLLFRVLPRNLRRLHTAVGTDPRNAAAWYHLAVFSGIAGDRPTASRARLQALSLLPDTDGRRPRLILEEAWDLRDAGLRDAALGWLAGHGAELDAAPTVGTQLRPLDEARLIRALCLADQGDVVAVRQAVADLPVLTFRYHGFNRQSRVLRAWVHARSALSTGDRDLAAVQLGFHGFMPLPPGVAWRYWQDVGLIAEALDNDQTARHAWSLAYGTRPFLGFFPQVSVRSSRVVLGRPGTEEPYVLGFRRHFLVGSLWSYAATAALACQSSDRDSAPWLWDGAFAALDACIRRGIHEADARLCRARLFLQAGDLDAARADLAARVVQDVSGRADQSELAFLTGVARLNEGDLEGCLPHLERSAALVPSYLRAWQALAVVHAYRGDEEQARAAFARVDQLSPDDGLNAFNKGLFFLNLGHRAEAEAELVRAARLLPGNPRPLELLQSLATGVEVTVDTQPRPVVLVASPRERGTARALDRLLSGDLEAGDLQALDTGDPHDRALWLDLLERAYRADPESVNRAVLAHAWLAADRPDAVASLLAPSWPHLDAAEARLLLDADRRLGQANRAADVARAVEAGEAGELVAVPVLIRAATILLDHQRRPEAERVLAAARLAAPDHVELNDLIGRLGGL